jgi:lambda family phage tail tape measure protein
MPDIVISIVGRTAVFDEAAIRSLNNARKSAKGIEDAYNGIDLGEARGGLMVFDELLGIHIPRHVTALLSTLPGLQVAMAAAFPLLAVVSVGKAIADLVEKEQKHAEEMAKQKEEVLGLTDAMQQHASSLEISNLKLQDQIRLLTGKPPINGPKELALETEAELKKLEKEYDTAIAKIGEFATANQQGMIMTALTGDDGSRELAGMIASHQAAQEKIKNDKLAAEADGNKAALKAADAAMAAENGSFDKYISGRKQKIQDEIIALTKPHETTQIDKDGNATQVTDQLSMADAINQVNIKYADQMPLLNSIVVLKQQYNKAVGDTKDNAGLKGQKDALTAIQQKVELEKKSFDESQSVLVAKNNATVASAKLEMDQGKITADQLAAIQEAGSEREYRAKQAFLQKILKDEAKNPELVKATQAEIEADTANHEARLLGIKDKAQLKDNEQDKQDLEALQKFYNKTEAEATQAAEFAQKQIQDNAKIALSENDIVTATAKQNTELQLARGHINQQQAAAQNLKTAQTDQAAQLKIINDELDAQREKLVLIGRATDGGTMGTDAQIEQYRKALEAYEQTKNQEVEITKKTNAEIAAANKAAANNETAQWMKMFQDYGNLSKQMNQAARQTFGQMNSDLAQFTTTGKADWKALAQSAITNIVQIGLQYVETQIVMAVAKKFFDSDDDTAKKIAMNRQLAMSNAGVAADATLALASATMLPPAPEVMAGVTFAIGSGFANAGMSAAHGAVLPNREALVHTHPEEMILPKHISNFIVNAANKQSGDGQGGNHMTINNHVQAGAASAKELKEMMNKQNQNQIKKLKRQYGVN